MSVLDFRNEKSTPRRGEQPSNLRRRALRSLLEPSWRSTFHLAEDLISRTNVFVRLYYIRGHSKNVVLQYILLIYHDRGQSSHFLNARPCM